MTHRHARYAFALAAVLTAGAVPGSAQTAPIMFSAASGALAAAVTFDIVAGSRLQVVLSNTAMSDVLVPADVLTGVYFGGVGALVPQSAVLRAGSTVVYGVGGQPAGGVVGGEWGYSGTTAGVPHGGTAALMSTGALSGLGHPNFPGSNLAGPDGLGGLQYGLLSAGDDVATGNGGITGSGGLVRNAMVFTFTGLPDGFSLDRLGNVSFQYGTSMSEPILRAGAPSSGGVAATVTPEPATMALLGAAMVGLGLMRRRRRRGALGG